MDYILNIQSFTKDLLAEHQEMSVFNCRYLNKVCEHDVFSELLKFNVEAVNNDLYMSEFHSVYFSKNVISGFVPLTSCMSLVFCTEPFRVKGKGIRSSHFIG
jgi:hypothetical protein